VEATKKAFERALVERKEKVLIELERMKQRIDEFNDFGELDMMNQYIMDVRAVQNRLAETIKNISKYCSSCHHCVFPGRCIKYLNISKYKLNADHSTCFRL